MSRRLLFRRDFRGYTGGQGKVWDYFGHAGSHRDWQPSVYLVPGGVEEDNPWLAHGVRPESEWMPRAASALFLAGSDWQAYPEDQDRLPVINLIQGLRHADPADPLSCHLQRRAVRVCVSGAVAESIKATGRSNGPILVIPAALDLSQLPKPAEARHGVFVGAAKHPDLGRALAENLRAAGHEVTLAESWLSRQDYLAALAACRIAIPLPLAREGFFLPGLEAMALGCATIAVDCIGNREYVQPGTNALSPAATVEDIAGAVARLSCEGAADAIAAAGVATAAGFDLPAERRAFHELLDQLDLLWAA